MDSLISLRRSALIYGLCIPIAVLMGFLLARPLSYTSLAFIALVLGGLSIPLLIRWHHPMLILTWNAALVVPFLPGQPNWWMCVSFVSLAMTILFRIMSKNSGFLSAPAVTFWIVFILVVVMVTAKLTGGVGARAIGTAGFGGKRYLNVVAAIVGYFALTGTRILPKHAGWLVVGFFLSEVTSAIPDLVFALGEKFYFVFYVFPSSLAYHQAVGESNSLERIAGMSFAAQAALVALLAHYGFRGVFSVSRPWRSALFFLLLGCSLFGGFRSLLIVLVFLFAFELYFERLLTTRNIIGLTGVVVLAAVFLMTFSLRMPTAVQRTLSFLPISVEENVRRDAAGSSEWRWSMWKLLLPDIPRYFWLGKGFTFNGSDLYLIQEAIRRGYYANYESTLTDGNYHNGILTTIIPFGIWGLIGLFGFLTCGSRVLYQNYRNGDPQFKQINTLLIAWFLARVVMYLTIYGSFDLDLPFFVGVVGLSLSLNGGVAKADETAEPASAT